MMEIAPEPPQPAGRRRPPRWAGWILVIVATILAFEVILVIPTHRGILKSQQSAAMQACRTIALAMFQYANDHNQDYPDGNSSTEVFQKLLDGKYVTDPGLFYLPMPGKSKARPGERLQPQNVCYDVTSGIETNSSDGLPVVFVTGFRVSYHAGANAFSLVRPFPAYYQPSDELGNGQHEPIPGVAVTYKSNSAWFRKGQTGANGMGFIPAFIPAEFDAQGQTYRQLTPEGVVK